MSTLLDLSTAKLNQLWSEVKDYYTDWEKAVYGEPMRRSLKELLEGALKAELLGYTKAGWYQRTKARLDYRNGFYRRNLITAFGLIPQLLVPRRRGGGFRTRVFHRYRRRWQVVDDWIRGIFILGVSTRAVGWVMKELLGVPISAGAVSAINKALDQQVKVFHERGVGDDYRYLFLDGVVQKVMSSGRLVKKLVLVAYGVTVTGVRAVIDFRVVKGETAHDWEVFLTDLYRRGFKGANLRLVVTDGGKGLLAALELVYPHVAWQRCWVHKLRNVTCYVPRRYQLECLAGARKIYLAANRREAVQRFKEWKRRWQTKVPKAVHCLEKDLDGLLTFFDEDKKLWVKLRTTNAIERLFRELRKRTRSMYFFSDEHSCHRIIYALFTNYNKKWEGSPLWKT